VSKAIARAVYDEILNEGNLDLVEELVDATAVDHAPNSVSSLPTASPAHLKAFVIAFCEAFPDAYWTVTGLEERGDLVTVRTVLMATQHDEFLGIRARGRELVLPGSDVVRVKEGRIVEHWGVLDVASMRSQLEP
jgi:predicted ester cyclase